MVLPRTRAPAARPALYLPNPTFGNPAWADADQRVLVVRLSSFRDVDRSSTHLVLARELRLGLPRVFVDLAFLPVAGRPCPARTPRRALPGRHAVAPGDRGIRPRARVELLPSRAREPTLPAPAVARARVVERARRRVADRGAGRVERRGRARHGRSRTATRWPTHCSSERVKGRSARSRSRRVARRGRPKAGRLEAMARAVAGLWPAGDLARTVRRAVAPPDALERQGDGVVPLLPGAEDRHGAPGDHPGLHVAVRVLLRGPRPGPVPARRQAGLLAAARALKRGDRCGHGRSGEPQLQHPPGVAGLLVGLHRTFALANPMSQRVDILARTPGLVDLELAADKRSFTLGIEGVSRRHARVPAQAARRRGPVALPGPALATRRARAEAVLRRHGPRDDRDLAEFAGFVKELRRRGERAEARPRTVFSAGMLVRMPFTPLAFDPVPLDEAAWRRISGRLKSTCETHGFEFRMAMNWTDWLLSQLAALGGYRVHGLLESLAVRGCVYDAELPREARAAIEEWCRDHPEAFAELAAEKPADHPFPFAFAVGAAVALDPAGELGGGPSRARRAAEVPRPGRRRPAVPLRPPRCPPRPRPWRQRRPRWRRP